MKVNIVSMLQCVAYIDSEWDKSESRIGMLLSSQEHIYGSGFQYHWAVILICMLSKTWRYCDSHGPCITKSDEFVSCQVLQSAITLDVESSLVAM